MSTIRHALVALCVTAGAAGTALAEPIANYKTVVQLHDGKQTCAINEPTATPASRTPTLTTSERNEAEIAATAALRRQAGRKQERVPKSRDLAACSVLVSEDVTDMRPVHSSKNSGPLLSGAAHRFEPTRLSGDRPSRCHMGL